MGSGEATGHNSQSDFQLAFSLSRACSCIVAIQSRDQQLGA